MIKKSTVFKIDLAPILMRRGNYQSITPPKLLLPMFIAGGENEAVEELFQPDAIACVGERSPIILFGLNGTGKTVLAHELLNRWQKDRAERKLTLTSGTELSRSLQRDIKADDMERFRQIHRDCDGLLIDNLHELVTKIAAQEELVSILKSMESDEKLVVITMPELPRLRSGLLPALQSRLSGGLSIPVQPPGPQARVAIAEWIAAEIAPEIARDQIALFCSKISEPLSVLQLKGMINRWLHQLHAENSSNAPTIKPSSIRQIEKLVAGSLAPKVNCREVLKQVAKEMKLGLDSLTGRSRRSGIVRARGLAMLLMRKLTDESFESIGTHFSDRDHTTVMHACKKTEEDLANDPELTRVYDCIRNKFSMIAH